jgi:hypothetical protein
MPTNQACSAQSPGREVAHALKDGFSLILIYVASTLMEMGYASRRRFFVIFGAPFAFPFAHWPTGLASKGRGCYRVGTAFFIIIEIS